MKKLLLILLMGGCHLSVLSEHISGVDISYRSINTQGYLYEFVITMYRDCEGGGPYFDESIDVFIFDQAGVQLDIITVFYDNNTVELEPPNWGACTDQPYELCIDKGTYRFRTRLGPRAGGYNVGWARCCRNYAISNLESPGDQGITTICHVPDPGTYGQNSSPIFNALPPVFLCIGQNFVFDHSATDPDGDSLVYRVSHPYHSLNQMGLGADDSRDRAAVTADNPMGPPPYQKIRFASGHSADDPFASGKFHIDGSSGILSLVPERLGLFVFGITVEEYRGGKKINETQRDFQINVIDCKPQTNSPDISHSFLPQLTHSNDTIFIIPGEAILYNISLSDATQNTDLALYPVSTIFDSNHAGPAASLSVSGENPMEAVVEWRSTDMDLCDVKVFIVGGKDLKDCPGYNIVFDTVYVSVGYEYETYVSDDSLCLGEVISMKAEGLDAVPVDWEWHMGNGDKRTSFEDTYQYGDLGVYPLHYRAVLANGCVLSDTFFVEVAGEPTVEFEKEDVSCFGLNNGSIKVIPTDGKDPYLYEWDVVQGGDFISGLRPGNYRLRLSNAFDCVAMFEPIEILEPDTLILFPGDIAASLCTQPNGSASVFTMGGTLPYSYTWNTDPIQRDSVALDLVGASYRAKVVDANGCEDTLVVDIPDNPPPVAAFTFSPDTLRPLLEGTTISFENLSQRYNHLRWNFGDGSGSEEVDPAHTFEEDGVYKVSLWLENSWGCKDSVDTYIKFVREGRLFFPSAFSPNGDGINDVFLTVGDAISSYELNIYSRWGMKCLDTIEDRHKGWDGRGKDGDILPEDTYVYTVKVWFDDGNIVEYAGTVILMR